MTNEEMDRAIAEHLGWVAHPTCKKVWRTPEQAKTNMELIGTVNGPWSTESSGPPKYSTDLNAMHEAEETLTGEQYLNYTLLLMDDYQTIGCVSRHSSATAEDRAINFLRTIGKYSDATHPLP